MENIKILYVEDDKILGKITSDVLIKAGYKVQWVYDGLKAVEVFGSQDFDICIIDIMLPGLDGYALVEKIRNANAEIPIIFLTARLLVEDVVKGFEIGGNDYLKKPFRIEELVVRVNALLKRKSAPKVENPSTEFTIGLYKFNYPMMQLHSSKKIKTLTNLENELLYALLTTKDEILQRNVALLNLWGNDNFYNSRSLDVYISKLRKYLAEDANISIINIRATGYRLIVRNN